VSTVRRYDAAPLAGVSRDRRGFASIDAYVSRCGVFPYRRADGTYVRELRHPDQVFRQDSIDSLRDASVTVDHPGQGLVFVDPDNAAEHEVGVVGAASRDNQYLSARVSVRRADAIRRIEARELVEVSAGYVCRIDATPGQYEGQPYDQQQCDIFYNHVALLPAGKGRQGRDVKLRVDSDDAVIADDEEAPPRAEKERPMSTRKVRVDGVEYELPISAADVLDKAVAERESHKKRADSAEAERDMVRADLVKAADPKVVSQRVQARVELERQAASVLGAEARFDSLTDREVREKVLSVKAQGFRLEGRSDDAISAAFEYAITNAGKQNEGLKLVTSALNHSTETRAQEQRSDSTAVAVKARIDELEARRHGAANIKTGA
jgi:hypothetical protein